MKSFTNKQEAELFAENLLSFVDNNNIDELLEKNFPQFYYMPVEHKTLLMNTPSQKYDNSMYMELWNTCVQKLYLQLNNFLTLGTCISPFFFVD